MRTSTYVRRCMRKETFVMSLLGTLALIITYGYWPLPPPADVPLDLSATDRCTARASAMSKIVPFFECMNQVFSRRQWYVSQGSLIRALRWGGPAPCWTAETEDTDVDTFVFYDGKAETIRQKAHAMEQCVVSHSDGYTKGSFTWGKHRHIPTYYKLQHREGTMVKGEPFWDGYEVHFLVRVGALFQPTTNSQQNPIFYKHAKDAAKGLPGDHWGYADQLYKMWGGHGVPANLLLGGWVGLT